MRTHHIDPNRIGDPSSLSNSHEATVTHLKWEATVDFTNEIFHATAHYNVKLKSSSVPSLRLDTSCLDIRAVQVDGIPVTFSLSVPDAQKTHLGSCLEVSLPLQSGSRSQATNGNTPAIITVSITYSTTSSCSAAQWLPPVQTAGKIYPYVFTQCQAIHARSLIPCMDCPSVKMTYEARVTVPSWATCVMSALSQSPSSDILESSSSNTLVYSFTQPIPIPSYLFALAIGQLSTIDISPRCKVWSEPSMVQSVAYEFAQVEDFLTVAESITGVPYQWKRYDVLCLPPSFPYGGMENPCLTFVTPTLLAGDRSLADVIAHEAAHSWSGNLVTNETWEHFWLNEGWTVFLQRKIMTTIHGNDKFFDFDAIDGWQGLKEDVKNMPEKYTRLIPQLGDNDPDEAFSSVPYEKGFNLLYSLEKLVGVEAFGSFIKAYFNKFKFGVISSEKFQLFFHEYFSQKNSSISEFDWDTWLYKPGLPETPDFDTTLSYECEHLAEKWVAFDDTHVNAVDSKVPETDISDWSTGRKICFLDSLLSRCCDRKKPLSLDTLDCMKHMYCMHESHNSEILFRFCMIAVESNDASILPVATRFITSQGRMKFVRPLYRALFQSDMGRDIAVRTFLEHKDFYHPIAAKMVAVDLSLTREENKPVNMNERKLSEFPMRFVIIGSLAAVATIGIALLRGRQRR